MSVAALECEVCHRALPEMALHGSAVRCGCGESYRFLTFAACFQSETRGERAKDRALPEAACYFHAEKVASVSCDACGRLLCSVCDVPRGGKHWCATCLAGGVEQAAHFESERWMHDWITLAVAVVAPVACFAVLPISACWALYRTVRYWSTPLSLVPRAKLYLVLAALVAVLQIGGMVALGVLLAGLWGDS
jgi:hypothetical protein